MKKLFFLFAIMFFSAKLLAQAPFTVYEPVNVPSRSYSVPSISFSNPFEELNRQEAAQSYANQVVSSEVVSANGFNIYTGITSPMRVKIVQRRNGIVKVYCLGIKKGDTWKSYDKEIVSLENMYNKATNNSDKSMILDLMEYGSHLLIIDIDREVYVIE